MRRHTLSWSVFLLLLVLAGISAGQKPASARVDLGSNTAKNGFKNEAEIARKFNEWRNDSDARAWLAAMGHDPDSIESVTATRPHGEKADVQIRIKTKKYEYVEGISIKLVSNPNGFNQIDKRWLANYARIWKMPDDVVKGLKFFVGETPPAKPSKNPDRAFLNELDAETQAAIVKFFSKNMDAIVSDIFEGDGTFAAKWFLAAFKATDKPRWVLRSSRDVSKFFSEGGVTITRAGNLKIGRITMQRKGGDGGRETAKMLQFKINPALLIETK